MIWDLPQSLNIAGTDYKIRSDYRNALLIFSAFNDPEMDDYEKQFVMLDCIYCDFETTHKGHIKEMTDKAVWFLDGGDIPVTKKAAAKVIDWDQDAKMLFSAVNKVAGKEIRLEPYLHWWTFLSLFTEMGECMYSTVINIRQKKAECRKLDKWEQELYKKNKELFDIKEKLSEKEIAERQRVNDLFS